MRYPQSSLLQTKQAQLPQSLLIRETLQTLNHLCGLCWALFQLLLVFCDLLRLELNTALLMWPHQNQVKGEITCVHHFTLPDAAQNPICLPSSQDTLLAHSQPVIHQDSQDFQVLCRTVL